MAQRRMFSPAIVNSDAFLEMPPSTQALYFQLGMKADDDGFVNPKMVMRMMGSTDDELKVIIAKKFVLPFENGVIVVKHWRMNNYVRKDRYKETVYLPQKDFLFVKPNQAYSLNDSDGALPIAEVPWKNDEEVRRISSGQPKINQWSTQDRLGKDRLEDAVDKKSTALLQEESEQELIPVDEDGNPIQPRWGAKNKDPKKGKNRVALELLKYFGELCQKELGQRPVSDFKGYTLVCKAITIMGEQQVREKLKAWFEEDKKSTDLIQITQALSTNQINKWLMERK